MHETIRIGFDGNVEDVPRVLFRRRVATLGRPDYIPINFFLYNKIVDGVDYIVADELVFQAILDDHSARFDKTALFAFNLSRVGSWKGAAPYQRWPALWAYHYVVEQVSQRFNWDARRVNADDIERFVLTDSRYRAQTGRKLATNLNYLFQIGRLQEFSSPDVERWWVDALFLALDRVIEDRIVDGRRALDSEYPDLLMSSGFRDLGGKRSVAKDLAVKHLITLYTACGGRDRFVDDRMRDRTEMTLGDVAWLVANNPEPQAAIHKTNSDIIKTIPRSCAMLARYYGFDVIDLQELSEFDPIEFVRSHTREALDKLKSKGVAPTLSNEELRKLTRE